MNTLLIAYSINWFFFSFYIVAAYLDIQSTMKFLTIKGDVETNPQMIPYVKPGQPWLMAYGKLHALSFLQVACFLIIPGGIFMLYYAYSDYKAYLGNVKLIKATS